MSIPLPKYTGRYLGGASRSDGQTDRQTYGGQAQCLQVNLRICGILKTPVPNETLHLTSLDLSLDLSYNSEI